VTDLPLTPLTGDLVVLELLDQDEIAGSGSRRILRRADGLVVGYGLVAAARRQGLMRDALTVLLRLTDAAGVRVRGATTRDNEASLASMRGRGFVVRDLLESPVDPEREVHLVREPSS
jgi:RimJ/RimL family protein N-acetyltransferase